MVTTNTTSATDTGFVTPTATPNFDPGFVSMPQTQDTSVQTFAPSTVPTTQTQSFVTSPVPTSAPISLAPFGAGLPRGDTSVSIGDVRSDSDGFGTAAAVGGGAALAALLNSLGQEKGGSGFSAGNVLGGVQKVASLAKMAGVDPMKMLKDVGGEVGEWAKNLFDGGSQVSKVSEAIQPVEASNIKISPQQLADKYLRDTGQEHLIQKKSPAQPKAKASTVQVPYQQAFLDAATPAQLTKAIGPNYSHLVQTNPAAAMGISSTSSVAGLGGPGSLAGGKGAGLVQGAGGSIAGALPVLALWAFSINRFNAHKDPTADTRAANQFENYFQRALQSPEQERLELENLKQAVYQNPASLAIMKIAARTADPNIQHTSGGTEIVGWKGQIPAKFEALLPELEAVAEESNQANYGGLYNIGDEGLMGSPPNPYGEETRTYDKEAEVWKPKPEPEPEWHIQQLGKSYSASQREKAKTTSLQPGQKGYDVFAPGAVQV